PAVRVHASLRRRPGRPERPLPGHPLLPRGRPRAGGALPGTTAGRGGGQRLPARPVRPGRLLRAAGEGGAAGRVPAPALRRSLPLRAPRPGSGRPSQARSDGLLSPRPRGGETRMPKRKKAVKKGGKKKKATKKGKRK